MTESPFKQVRLTGLLLLLLLAFLLDLSTGTVNISLKEILHIFFSPSTADPTGQFIVKGIRLPKACTAVLAGCGLSVGGLQCRPCSGTRWQTPRSWGSPPAPAWGSPP